MLRIADLSEFGYFQIQFFISHPTDKLLKSLLSVPLKPVAEHAVGSVGGRRVLNNALNVSVKEVPSQIGHSGFRYAQVFKQVWKDNGLCVGFLYTHKRLGETHSCMSSEAALALEDLRLSTWRYSHAWEGNDSPGLVSVICIDKSMRKEAEREIFITGDHLDLVTYKKGSCRKAKLEEGDKKSMLEAKRLLERLRS